MSALDCINRVMDTKLFEDKELRYCLVGNNKNPYKIDGTRAASNDRDSFVEFNKLVDASNIETYKGIGISIQFSNICGVDVDHCFGKELDFTSADERAKDIFNIFKDFAYIEYSFSGKGMRVLFRTDSIPNYKELYLIKNSKLNVEYYQPSYGNDPISYRYLTITGNIIVNNPIIKLSKTYQISKLNEFLSKYMKREKELIKNEIKDEIKDDRTLEELLKITKHYLLVDWDFQDNWFKIAPGSNSNESERDYWLCEFIFNNITKDHDKIIKVFEESNFYKTKDFYHLHKWSNNNHHYFDYIYNKLKGK